MRSFSALIEQNRPLVMGILNTTPDSFSDGGQYTSTDTALDHAMQMLEQGADIIDVGGESTRPGAEAVSENEEIQRVVPVIESIRQRADVCISVDSSKPGVMRAAVNAGADMLNDVNALRAPGALQTCAELAVPVCIMHMQGEPRTMQKSPSYRNVVQEVSDFLRQRVEACIDAGISRHRLIIDPGFGFGKNLQHNLQLLRHLQAFKSLELPLLIGISRKSMLGQILDGAPVEQRVSASIAAAVLAWTKGASIFRVHDVKATVDALKVCQAIDNP